MPCKGAFSMRYAPHRRSKQYEIAEFLAMLSLQDLHSVIDLLISRVEAREAAQPGASPAPHTPGRPVCASRRSRGFPDLPAPRARVARRCAGLTMAALPRIPAIRRSHRALRRPDPPGHRGIPDRTRPGQDQDRQHDASRRPRTLVWNPDFVRRCLGRPTHAAPRAWPRCKARCTLPFLPVGAPPHSRQPFPEDVEQRDTADKLAARAVPGSLEEQLYRAISQNPSRQAWIARTTSEEDLPMDGRDWSARADTPSPTYSRSDGSSHGGSARRCRYLCPGRLVGHGVLGAGIRRRRACPFMAGGWSRRPPSYLSVARRYMSWLLNFVMQLPRDRRQRMVRSARRRWPSITATHL